MTIKYTNENFSGTKLGYLTAIRFSHRVRNSIACWVFRCECGVEKTIELSSVLRSHATSCGCQSQFLIGQKNRKHGHAKSTEKTPSATYISWFSMLQRCGSDPTYKNIDVCDEWKNFENFLNDMGERPKSKSIDRIDSSKGYYKANCRWATKTEQSQNRRKLKIKTSRYKGVSYLNDANKWVSYICVNGKNKYLKRHSTEEDAALAYNNAAISYFGEFAVLNILPN